MTQHKLTIDDFYAENELRRDSAEFEFGDGWTDASGNLYELSWVESTGELYLMLEPEAEVGVDAFGDFWVGDGAEGLSVVVIGQYENHEAVTATLEGWEEAVGVTGSLSWLFARVTTAQ